MGKIAREVSGFVALPVHLPSAIHPQTTEQHYIYLRPHDPGVPDEDAARSLFLVNVPVTTTEAELKHLFTTQLQAGRIDKAYLAETVPGRTAIAATKAARSSRKRKRMDAEEIASALDNYSLPRVWPSEVHCTGGTAIVVFVDRASMDLTVKAARKAVKSGQQIVWRDGLGAAGSAWGLQRYSQFNALRYPSQRELLRSVDGYMSAFGQMEEARSRENARKRQVPDEDGFVTVTRGSRGGVRAEEAKELAEKQKSQTAAVQDFYRFQLREKRKQQHDDMLKKFDQDKQKIADMQKRRTGR